MTRVLTALDLLVELGDADRTERTAQRRLRDLRRAGLRCRRVVLEGSKRWCYVVDRSEWERFIGEDTMAIASSQRVDAAA